MRFFPSVVGVGLGRALLAACVSACVWGCGDAAQVMGPQSAGREMPAPSTEAPRRLERVGIQLYTLRAAAEADLEGTLRRVAELGYDEVEFAGLFGNDPAAVRALLDELGLVAVANHVDWEIVREDPQRGIDETLALGAEYMVFAWMPPAERGRLDQWQTWIDRLNAVARSCDEAGLRFAYHNHDFEFQPIDGVVPYDRMLEGLDARWVDLELDFYWLALAGGDPLELFQRSPGRFRLGHVKDMNLGDRSMADVGQGGLDFARAFADMDRAGMQHFFVERDDASDPWQTAEVSLSYLRQIEF